MKEFIEKLIERLEERISNFKTLDMDNPIVRVSVEETERIIEIANELAEEYNNG